jgi:dTDP-4-dehydrorhamnose 3,5-epimerase
MADPLALRSRETPIPGLLVVDLPVHGDNRGWFKEAWQREKMIAIGVPDFGPVQNNFSFNLGAGATRGLHAEPWDKFVTIAAGRIFGAWVDLRDGPTFGATFTIEVDPSRAIFVPRGVANGYQTLEPNTVYSYLVNDHWSPNGRYTFLNVADPTVAIEWPIPLQRAEVSEKDRTHPLLGDVIPMPGRRTLVVGAGGQLGTALRRALPDAEFATRHEFDLTAAASYSGRHWPDFDTIINAAGYTAVDAAETTAGRAAAWEVNVVATTRLARIAAEHRITLVQVSSDYVFDGTKPVHREDEAPSPLNVYGQTKAAADAVAATVPRHYIVRTSWVIGDGRNFVRTMAELAQRGVSPAVVDDQVGRLTFTSDLAAGICHLLDSEAPYGTYNLTNDGEPQSWAQLARKVFELTGHDPAAVTGVATAEYLAGRSAAPRPPHSTLDLAKIQATGFVPRDADAALREYLARP